MPVWFERVVMTLAQLVPRAVGERHTHRALGISSADRSMLAKSPFMLIDYAVERLLGKKILRGSGFGSSACAHDHHEHRETNGCFQKTPPLFSKKVLSCFVNFYVLL